MDTEKLILFGKELGYAGVELHDWVEKERNRIDQEHVRQREERVRLRVNSREAAKETQDTAVIELRRFRQEQQVPQMRLQLQGGDGTSGDLSPQDTGDGEN